MHQQHIVFILSSTFYEQIFTKSKNNVKDSFCIPLILSLHIYKPVIDLGTTLI